MLVAALVGAAGGAETNLLAVAFAARVDFKRHAGEFPFAVLAQGFADPRLGVLGLAVLKAAEEREVIVVGRGDEPEQFALVDPCVGTRLAMAPSNVPTNEVLPLTPAPPPPGTPPAPHGTAPNENATPPLAPGEAPGDGTFKQSTAPENRTSAKIRFSTGTPASRGGSRVVQVTDETETTNIAMRYEEQEGRFTIAVSHIHGYEGPRYDVLSVGSCHIRDRALETNTILLDDIERFIEVKGRNQRTGAVELSENELLGAEKFGTRYFIYRVFCDPTDPSCRELAILGDPLNSPARHISRIARFPFHDESGAVWFSLARIPGDAPEPSDSAESVLPPRELQ